MQKRVWRSDHLSIFTTGRSTHSKPVKVHNVNTGQQIRFKIYCNCGPGNNPSQSETSGHIGGNGNYPCRKCDAGGPQKVKETDEGFHKMFCVSPERYYPEFCCSWINMNFRLASPDLLEKH
jgi:hypothetical protein